MEVRNIRTLIGEGDPEAAIDELLELLYASEHHASWRNPATLLKGRWTKYKKASLNQLADDNEYNQICHSVLEILAEVEKTPTTSTPSTSSPQYAPPQPQFAPPPPNYPPPQPQAQYVAKCVFYGDVQQYFLLPNNQIVAIGPMTNNMPVHAANCLAPNAPNIRWVYWRLDGFYYNVDHAGAIWGVNAFMQPQQVGYVQYF